MFPYVKIKAPEIGSTWRSPEGGPPMTVVAIEDGTGFIITKRADSPKKVLANKCGGYLSAPSEFAEWKPA